MIQLDFFLGATGGKPLGQIYQRDYPDFCYDSRLLRSGELFLAVKTNKGDGHDYIEEAARRGAGGIVCQRPIDLAGLPVTVIQVPDTQSALLDWAGAILRHYGTQVVGITGSTGKTSTKEAIATVLATRFPVFRNYANYNGRFGLPIALGRLEPQHQIAVLEMACDSFDEIRLLAEITRPRVGVVTAVNHTHLAYLGSLANIAQEKGQLIRALPGDGFAVLNIDDPLVRPMAGWTSARVITYGRDPAAHLRLLEAKVVENGTHVILSNDGRRYPLSLQLIGRHTAYLAMAAIAVGLAYDIPPQEAITALESLKPLPGRLRPLAGRGGISILDDTYNASPASSLAALDTLNHYPARQRVAVIGFMADLGSFEEEGHRLVGRRAAQSVDMLIVKDERARAIATAAEQAGLSRDHILLANTDEEIQSALHGRLGKGDVILIKGSQESRLEALVKGLMAHPEKAAELLVRQNEAWQRIRLVQPGRPTWVEVDLGAIGGNVRLLKELIGPNVQLMAVLKADGYGHGAIRVARTALNNSASYLGVACVGEAVHLRDAGINDPILVLGYTPAWQARELVLAGAAATVFSLNDLCALSRAAQELNKSVPIHVKVDTGMGRLGILPSDALPFVRQVLQLSGLWLEGIFTHFSVADWADKSYTLQQLATFQRVLAELHREGIHVPLVHAANSAATLTLPESHFSMVRAGIAMYGLSPSDETPLPAGFRPAMTFKTQVAQVKELPPGSFVSYGNTYCTRGTQHIAVIPVGYADGFRRAPAHWKEVLVKGRRAPIIGRVCMDQTMIDVTDIPDVRQGDEVILIGRQGVEAITAEDVARNLGTINYEIVSEILARVPRVS